MLDKFFKPRSVAIIGASQEPGKVGHHILKNIIEGGFAGGIYPINPKAKSVLGKKTYAKVSEVKNEIELAVIAIPFQYVLGVIEECGEKKIGACIIISAGFKESGPEGAKMELQLKQVSKKRGVRILGPNCLGLIDTHSRLNASFAQSMPPKGNIAFFSQSGALCTAVLDWALAEGIGFSSFISLGNKADIDEVDLLRYLEKDSQTSVILGYLEGVEDGAQFMAAAKKASKKKPLIITKSGGSKSGARAASSHTGTLAGREVAYRAAFKQCGVIRAESVRDLFDFALAFSYQPIPTLPNLAIVTNAGGPGIIAADACESQGIELSRFRASTVEKLRQNLPSSAALYNPVDVIGDADFRRYYESGKTIIEDPGVGGLLFILTPQAMTEIESTASSIVKVASLREKPVFASFMGKKRVAKGIEILFEHKIPNYTYPEDAIKSYKAMVEYRKWTEKPQPQYSSFKVKYERAKKIISEMRKKRNFALSDMQAREVISAYGFRVPKTALAETSQDAIAIAEEIGYPVVMKVASPDILHKSDVGGVKVGLRDATEVKEAFQEVISKTKRYMSSASIWGVSIQELISAQREVILGTSKDPQFGSLIMFGLGGIYTEVMKDVVFRVVPLDMDETRQMITEIRSYPILKGVRGEPPTDIDAIAESLLRLSQLAVDFPEITELDINPLSVGKRGEGAVAVDVRIMINEEALDI